MSLPGRVGPRSGGAIGGANVAKISVSHMALILRFALLLAGRYDHTRPYILARANGGATGPVSNSLL